MHALLTAIITGGALGLSAGFAPGPLNTLLIRESLRHGRGAGLRLACVPLLSDAPVVTLSILLLARLAQVHLLLGLISLCGAGFVGFLAYDSFRTSSPATGPEVSAPVSLIKGVLLNWANPHPYLFWITVGAPMVLRPGTAAGAVLFIAGFYVCLVGAEVIMAVLTGSFARTLTPRWYVWINRLLGTALFILAGLLAGDRIGSLTRQ